MGSKPRKIKDAKEALLEIGRLEDTKCNGCKIKAKLKDKGEAPHDIQNYCMFDCKIGRRIKALGGIIEYGVETNARFKAPDLTKEKYIELRKTIGDKEIRKIYNLSRSTLTRRKKGWGLTEIREYIIPSLVLKDLTKKKLEELSKEYSDREIAEMYGVAKVTILKRRKEWGITKEDRFLHCKFTLEEYKYLSKVKGLKDWEIVELWEISPSSILNLKRDWGIYKPRKIPTHAELAEMGLTRERMIQLVPENADKIIADMYGLYEQTVTKYRKALEISHTLRYPKNRIKPEHIKPLIDKGLNRREIGEMLGVHYCTITDIINDFRERNLI